MKPIAIAAPLLGQEEEQAVWEVIESGQLAQGSRVDAFEQAFAALCGVKHAIATTSGTTALYLAILAHGIGKGDQVITTPFTFIASANAILFAGAEPVFVDIDERTFNMNPELIEAAITPRTRAILPIHLFGQACDMPAIMDIAQRHNLVVIEDACQAHGATVDGRRVGSFGTGCFSFYPTKNITTAEGGMVTTNDDDVAKLARMLRNHGQSKRYYHDIIGYNFRMTEIHAAIGLAQMGKLEQFTAARQANAAYLNARLQGVITPYVAPGYGHVYHQYTIRVPENRDALLAHLTACGIGTSVYYPVPVHKQLAYQKLGYTDSLPVSEKAAEEVLALPVHPALTSQDLDRIVEGVNGSWC